MTTTTGNERPKGERRTGAETRAEILRVALKLFTEKGFEATSTRDISGELGITKSALYYHFENKGAIVTSLIEERQRELEEFIDWITAQPAAPELLQRAALRWVESTTPERLKVIRLAHANQPVIGRLVEGGRDIRSAFERVVDLLVDEDATAEERLLTRMAFDTVSAALLSAQGTDTGPDDVISAAQRATVALARATTHPDQV
ncbi:MAG: TetR/AcrR family transcriptional regulator [Actinomycetota bacterium]|nr:TetR/AcrR family transcriptional regulator [Actinomycetota bacterium]